MLVAGSDEVVLFGHEGDAGAISGDVILELLTEFFDEGDGGHGGGVAERAEGAAHHVFGEVLDVVDVLGVAAALVDAGEGFLDPVGAFAAGDAPAAALVLVELDGAQGELDDRYGLVEHHDAAGSEHGAGLGHLVEVEADIDLVGQEDGAGAAARDNSLQLLAVEDAAGDLVDGPLHVEPHRELVDAGALDMAGDAEEPRSAVPFRAELGVGLAAHEQDARGGGNSLDVVDDGRTAIEADNGGEGRLDAGDAALALERLHQGGLFADLVRPGASLGDDVEVDALFAEDVLAQDPLCVGVGNGLLDDLEQITVLATEIDKAHLCADGETGDHGALDHGVRIFKEDDVVLAGAGLGLVAVDQDVLGLFRLLGDKGPFEAGGEAGTATSAQAGGLHGVDDPLGTFFHGLLDGLIAVEFHVLVDVAGALAEAALEDDNLVGTGDVGGHLLTVLWRHGRRGERYVMAAAFGVAGQDPVHLCRREVFVKIVVDLDSGRPAAGADALDLFEREEAVGGNSLVADAELCLAVVEDLVAAAQHAGDVGADLHVVLARRYRAKHRVIAKDVANVELKEIEAGWQSRGWRPRRRSRFRPARRAAWERGPSA